MLDLFKIDPKKICPSSNGKLQIAQHLFVSITILTLFRMGGGGEQKRPPNQFFPCNFYKRKNYPKNFLTFSFNPFAILV